MHAEEDSGVMSLRACVLSLLYMFGLRNGAKGLILTPSEETAVLCEGEELELICTSNETFLQWSWSLQFEHGKVLEYSRFSSSTDASQLMNSFSVNSTSFNVSRVSNQGRSPLVSRLLITPVSLKVNAVIIANCTEVQGDGMASITINMVGNINANYPNLPEVNSSVIEYGIFDVTVRLQWIPQNDMIYNISINPKVAIVDLMTTPGVQFSVSYNIHYEVSIVATSSCGQNRTIVSLYYAACDYPLQEGNSDANYTRPALEGTSVMFDCPPGLELTGSESATCMENGEWEPNITCSRPPVLTTTNSQDAVMCTYNETSLSQCNSDGNAVLSGILIGSLAGIGSLGLVVVTIICVVITILIFKRKSQLRFSLNTNQRDAQDKQGIHLEGTIIYADIGPATARPSASISLDLDDSHVEYSRLNLKMMEQQLSKSQTLDAKSETEIKFDDDHFKVDLDSLLIQLRAKVSPFWYQFGKAAGLKTEVLDQLVDKCLPQECIVEVFDCWIRQQSEAPSWRDVAKILKMIHLEQLSAEIETVYTTGKLPIEVNMDEEIARPDVTESPPPIPLKQVAKSCTRRDFDHRDNDNRNINTNCKSMRLPPPLPPVEASPALPPKPKIFTSAGSLTIPPRPPKP